MIQPHTRRSMLHRQALHGFMVKTSPRTMELKDAYEVITKQVKELRALLQVDLLIDDRQPIIEEIIRLDQWVSEKNKQLYLEFEINEDDIKSR